MREETDVSEDRETVRKTVCPRRSRELVQNAPVCAVKTPLCLVFFFLRQDPSEVTKDETSNESDCTSAQKMSIVRRLSPLVFTGVLSTAVAVPLAQLVFPSEDLEPCPLPSQASGPSEKRAKWALHRYMGLSDHFAT